MLLYKCEILPAWATFPPEYLNLKFSQIILVFCFCRIHSILDHSNYMFSLKNGKKEDSYF